MLFYVKMCTDALTQQLILRSFHEFSKWFRRKGTEEIMMYCSTSARLGGGLKTRGTVI
jgi:hypothetical protein